jgi:predicted RNase H-like HicB family nuclease
MNVRGLATCKITQSHRDCTKAIRFKYDQNHSKNRMIEMLTYTFKVVIEEDPFEDGKMAYHAYCPVLEKYGASTWGYTKREALKNIQDVTEMIIDELIEEGKPIPENSDEVQIFSEPRIMVTV